MIRFPLPAALEAGAFAPLDRHFAALALALHGTGSDEVALAAALVSRQLARGHTCLDLSRAAELAEGPDWNLPAVEPWAKALRASAAVGGPGGAKPLILDANNRLYLHRFWTYEQTVAAEILGRLRQAPVALDSRVLAPAIAALFPDSAAKPNWQKVAAFAALRHRFSIITGGPGTGKTWTVARLLALLLQLPGNEALRVRVAAPTGKAVARLRESLTASLEKMPCPEAVRQRLQDRELTTTIHRLLVPIPNTGQFRHDPENPLPLDVLVVDETSMVSLSLMARLLAALRPEARLVLVGDKDQLPPVDPGGVLADLCEVARQNEYSKGFREQCKACTGEDIPTGDVPRSPPLQDLSDAVVRLRINHRSGNAVALHKLGVAVNGGDLDAILGTLKSATGDETAAVSWQRPTRLGDALRDAVVARYVPVLKASGPEAALAALGKFRILCALREGPSGTNAVNELVTQILADEAPELAEAIRGGFYAGKPVMVTANNYVLRLFNGDVGVFTQQNDSWQACFPAEEGGVRFVARERLPDSETVYAMTVHKSQGSEFDHVILVLPEQDNPVLSRELLYTAVTRARQSVRLVGSEAVLRMAVARLATRMSGLKEALGWRPGDASVAAAPPNAHKTAAGIGSQTQLNL